MAIQFTQFNPLVPQHYTLAETQQEKDAENARKIAQINAQSAGSMAESAMRAEYDQANRNADRLVEGQKMSAAQEQLGVVNDYNQQNLDASIANNQQQEARLGAQAAEAAARDNRIVSQQDFQNERLRTQDQRAAVEAQRADAEYAAKKAIEDRMNAHTDIGEGLLLGTPDENGEIDLTDHISAVAQRAGGGIPSNTRIKAFVNPETKSYDLFTVDAKGGYSPVMRGGAPLSISSDNAEIFKSAAKTRMGGGKERAQNWEVIYQKKLSPDGMSVQEYPVSLHDKITNEVKPYTVGGAAPTSDTTLSKTASAFDAALKATKEANAAKAQAAAPTLGVNTPSARERAAVPDQSASVVYTPNGDLSQTPHNKAMFAAKGATPVPAQQPVQQSTSIPSLGPRQHLADTMPSQKATATPAPAEDKYIVPEGVGISQEKFDTLSADQQEYLMRRWAGASIAKGVGGLVSNAAGAINAEASKLGEASAVRRGLRY